MYLELLWGNQCEWILDRQLQPGEGSPDGFLLQPLKWDHRSQASQSCAYWYHLQGRTGMSEADQGPLSTSNWSRNHRSQGLWAGVPAGPVLVFEGVHAWRCIQVHPSVSCCALTHLSWLKGDCGAWRRVLNNHQYNPHWSGSNTCTGLRATAGSTLSSWSSVLIRWGEVRRLGCLLSDFIQVLTVFYVGVEGVQ